MKIKVKIQECIMLFVIIISLVGCQKSSPHNDNDDFSDNITKTREVVNEEPDYENQNNEELNNDKLKYDELKYDKLKYDELKYDELKNDELKNDAPMNEMPESITQETEDMVTIGWSVYDPSRQYFAIMEEGVLAKAKDLGINVITHDQKADTSEMINGALNLIDQGIDALVISPVNPNVMGIITKSAKTTGIPVIVVDGGTGGADVDAFIVSDSVGGGVFAAQYALKLIKDHNIKSNKIAIFKVEETAPYARRRGDAFKYVMVENGYNVVANVTTNSDVDLAYKTMEDLLKTNGDDLAVVFAENDLTALPVAQAIADAGKKGEIMVIGFDAVPAALEAIKEGFMQGTIAQQPFEMGALGVELAKAVLDGDTILYDDPIQKELYIEVYLVDETGTVRKTLIKQ